MLELSRPELETCAGWRAGQELEEQSRRTLLGYWCRLSSAASGVGEVSRRAGSTSVEGVEEDQNPATSQKSREGGMGVGGWESGGLPQRGSRTPTDLLITPNLTKEKMGNQGLRFLLPFFPTLKTEL